MRRDVINDRLSGWRLALYRAVYPMSGYWRDPEKPWMLLKLYDGTWHTDVNVLLQQPKVKADIRKLKEISRGR